MLLMLWWRLWEVGGSSGGVVVEEKKEGKKVSDTEATKAFHRKIQHAYYSAFLHISKSS